MSKSNLNISKNEKRAFLYLFKKSNKIKFEPIITTLNLPKSFNDWKSLLETLKVEKYFQITTDGLLRNNKKTPYEKFISGLKASGKRALKYSIPIAIALATGGTNMPIVIQPILQGLKNYFKKLNITVPDSIEENLVEMLKESQSDVVNSLIDKIFDSNESKSSEISPEQLRNEIQMGLQHVLYPLVSEIEAVIGNLENKQQYFADILEGWILEQREYISQQATKTDELFGISSTMLNKITSNLIPAAEKMAKQIDQIEIGIENANKIIIQMNSALNTTRTIMEKIFNQLCVQNLTSFSIDKLFKISELQFQKVKLHGKFEKHPFNPRLFISNPQLNNNFRIFLNSPYPLYLMLANNGMGKTWNSIYLALSSRIEKRVIPFFIPIYDGYEQILSEIFENVNAATIGKQSKKIYNQHGVFILLIFDGLDEFPGTNKTGLLNLITGLAENYNDSIKILITTRFSDWKNNRQITSCHQTLRNYIFPNPKFNNIRSKFKITTPVSWFISQFSDEQLDLALKAYKLPKSKFPKKLLELCKRPYILRIIYERNEFPNPDSIEEFSKIVYNPDNPENTIFERMNIVGPVEIFFQDLLYAFKSANIKKSYRELNNLIAKDRESWDIILLSGLIEETYEGFVRYYSFNPIFKPIITKLMNDLGIEQQTPPPPLPPNPPPVPPIDSQPTLQWIKKFNYFIKLGDADLNNGDLENAIKNYKEAENVAKQNFEADYQLQAQKLIKKAESLIKTNKLKNNLQKNIDQAEQLVKSHDWQNALKLWQNALAIAQQLNDKSIIKQIETQIENCKIQIQKEEEEEKRRQYIQKRAQLNQTYVEDAKKLFALKNFTKAIELFQKSLEICKEMGWNEGIEYANRQILNAQNALKKLENIRKNATNLWNTAIQSYNSGNYKQALNQFEEVIQLYSELNDEQAIQKVQQYINKIKDIIEPKSYHGTLLVGIEYQFMMDLEKLLGGKPIPKVSQVSWDTFGYVENDQHVFQLGLYDQGLSSLPESIGYLKNLEKLYLGYNKLSSFLYNNKLSSLPESIGDLKNLKYLYLNSNKLSSLPESIGNLINLRKLDISWNKLSSLPEIITKMTWLKVLNIGGNQISSLPESIGNLKNLKELDLSGNKLSSLPES
ncbi:MAG: leucine-rich repeat domain-containing protein, partial [Promethearchaeota archaeon]